MISTSSRTLFSPAMPTSIGPTPQKNGRILGMFDLLDENTENEPPAGEMARHKAQLQCTPSKKPAAELDSLKLGRTPMSSSKRNMLNAFVTPSKRKAERTTLLFTKRTSVHGGVRESYMHALVTKRRMSDHRVL